MRSFPWGTRCDLFYTTYIYIGSPFADLVLHTHARSLIFLEFPLVWIFFWLTSHWTVPLFKNTLVKRIGVRFSWDRTSFSGYPFLKEIWDSGFHRTVPPLFFAFSIPHFFRLCNMAICKKYTTKFYSIGRKCAFCTFLSLQVRIFVLQ